MKKIEKQKNIKKIVGVGTKETDLFLYTPVLKRIIENSIIDSKDNNTDVTPEILFLNFLEEGEGVGIRILLISNIDLDKLYLEFKDNYKNKKNKNVIPAWFRPCKRMFARGIWAVGFLFLILFYCRQHTFLRNLQVCF